MSPSELSSTPTRTQEVEVPAAISESIRKLEERVNTIPGTNVSSEDVREEDDQLESHEVVELQAFIERKEWIEDRIAYLESLPLVDIFLSEQDINSGKTHATRAQLEEWLTEQDKIEKETEIFDSGDLQKLKKWTKAATQRNLSPEDTDLIEVTLSTLLALDRLFNLLRDRAERLELLGLRLSWEEHCSRALSSYSDILADSQSFLKERARWSPTIYSFLPASTSGSANSEASSRIFSRSARFSLADSLAKDIAQISSRMSALRLGDVIASGKILDKLIEGSSSSVPDWMLDEQDGLEEKCVKELVSVAKFLQSVVMQWNRADELYAESIKDCVALDDLLGDVVRATQGHPSRKTGNMLKTRFESFVRRISNRSDPNASNFPMPVHSAFPDQIEHNRVLAQSLASSLNDARELAQKVNELLKQYAASCDLIDSAEAIRGRCLEARSKLGTLAIRLRDGVDSSDGHSPPPNLADPACVDPLHSSTYLAMFPSLVDEVSASSHPSIHLIQEARKLLVSLTRPGIQNGYVEGFMADINALQSSVEDVNRCKEEADTIVQTLKDVRRIWVIVGNIGTDLHTLANTLREEIQKHRWTQQIGGEIMPPTPESLVPVLVADDGRPCSSEQLLKEICNRLSEDVKIPLENIKSSLPEPLRTFLQDKLVFLENTVLEVRTIDRLLSAVRQQTSAMDDVREEAHLLENQIEEAKVSYDEYYNSIKSDRLSLSSDLVADDKESALLGTANEISDRVNAFLSGLHARIPIIGQTPYNAMNELSLKNMGSLERLSLDASTIDNAVRSDSNAYAIRLSGALTSLLHKRSLNGYYKLYREAILHLSDAHGLLTLSDERCKEAKGKLKIGLTGEGETLSDAGSSPDADFASITDALSSAEACVIKMREFLASNDDTANEDCSAVTLLLSLQERLNEEKLRLDGLKAAFNAFEAEVLDDSAKRLVSTDADEVIGVKIRKDDPPDEDVFGTHVSPLQHREVHDSEAATRAQSLKKRLKCIGLTDLAIPGSASSSALPTEEAADCLLVSFKSIEIEAKELLESCTGDVLDAELHSLKAEVELSRGQLTRIQQLSRLFSSTILCDSAFSEFLDYIDSHEGPSHAPSQSTSLPSSTGEILSERMARTKSVFEDMIEQYHPVADDPRAAAEYNRLKQTWEELAEMAVEKLNGRVSRPGSASAFNSGRSSKASSRDERKGKYDNLSVSSRDGFLDSPFMQRRSVSSSSAASASALKQPREPTYRSRMPGFKSYNTRSVSGPASPPMPSRSLFSSTFSSRQRTTSISSVASSGVPGVKPSSTSITIKRRMSSALSELPRTGSPVMQPNPRGTWSRAPRKSLLGPATPESHQQNKAKKYIANPENKLDVALGDVINNLPVDINVEAVINTWKDKSGKYWIGGDEPKLCFCRILRSQTVMVRVGGGWQELSKFIKTHFADLFRIIPESPERIGTKERWISASTLRRGSEASLSTRSPGTPESLTPSLPSFALSTPDGTRTSTVQTPSPAGSPLTPLQFIRRADVDQAEVSLSSLALSTHLSKSSTPSRPTRPRRSTTNNQAKVVWRP